MDMYLIPSIEASENKSYAYINVYTGLSSTLITGCSIADCWRKLRKYLLPDDKLKVPNDYVGYQLQGCMEQDGFTPQWVKWSTTSNFFANPNRKHTEPATGRTGVRKSTRVLQ